MKNQNEKKAIRTKAADARPACVSDYEANVRMAEAFIEAIESGDVGKWRKNWGTYATPAALYYAVVDGNVAAMAYTCEPVNLASNFLNMFCEIPAGFYVTMKQLKAHKQGLRKGAKGVPTYELKCVFHGLSEEERQTVERVKPGALEALRADPDSHVDMPHDAELGQLSGKRIVWDRFHERPAYLLPLYVLTYLFRVEDMKEPIDVKALWNVGERTASGIVATVEAAEAVKASYIERCGISYRETTEGNAYYSPAAHAVTMPKKDTFESSEAYYQTMFHEMGHSTGHPKLLNRATLNGSYSWGHRTDNYSREELVAEMSSCMTLDGLGMLTPEIFANSAAYLKSWGEELHAKIRHSIAKQTQSAVDASRLVLGVDEKHAWKGPERTEEKPEEAKQQAKDAPKGKEYKESEKGKMGRSVARYLTNKGIAHTVDDMLTFARLSAAQEAGFDPLCCESPEAIEAAYARLATLMRKAGEGEAIYSPLNDLERKAAALLDPEQAAAVRGYAKKRGKGYLDHVAHIIAHPRGKRAEDLAEAELKRAEIEITLYPQRIADVPAYRAQALSRAAMQLMRA